MGTIVARTGRLRQRYEKNLRLVSGCIPYRLVKGSIDHDALEVLMISSPNRDDMVFPKGGWENDETVEEAACREALEEAGVRGILGGKPLGVWEFRSKSSQEACSTVGGCKGYMFALEVREELDVWPEQGNRGRKWLSVVDAFKFCRYDWMRAALEEFKKVMSENSKPETCGGKELEPIPPPLPIIAQDCQILPTKPYLRHGEKQKQKQKQKQLNNKTSVSVSLASHDRRRTPVAGLWHGELLQKNMTKVVCIPLPNLL